MLTTKYAGFTFIVLFWCCVAAAQTAIIPRLSTAPHDAALTYKILKNFLSDPMNGSFSIVRADSATHLLIAKRNGINTKDWNDWTYCKLGPDQMLDTLEDGMVTLTVKIEPAGAKSSNVSITADFKGTYGFAGTETTAQCVSKGVLENRMLEAVGAMPESS